MERIVTGIQYYWIIKSWFNLSKIIVDNYLKDAR